MAAAGRGGHRLGGVRGDGHRHGFARPQGRRRGERRRRRPGPGRQVGDLGFAPRVRRRVLPDVAGVRRPPGPLRCTGCWARAAARPRPDLRRRIGIVTDNDDPDKHGAGQGQVPVAERRRRVVVGADRRARRRATDYGIVWVPQVNDEVLVGVRARRRAHAVRRSAGCGTAWTPIPFDTGANLDAGTVTFCGFKSRTGHQITSGRAATTSSIQLADQGRRDRDHARRAELGAEDQGPGQGLVRGRRRRRDQGRGLDEARGHRADDDQGRDRRDQLEDAERWHSRSSWATRSRGSARSTRSRTRPPVRRSPRRRCRSRRRC